MTKLELVENWRKLWKSTTMIFGALGLAVPELLQILADNTDLVPWMDDGYKSGLRLACLIAIVLLRPVKQESLTK